MISGTTRPISDKQIHHQLIAFAGAGKLLDGSPCSIEFRAFLASVGSRHLSAYVDQCLSESFDEVERLLAAATACLGRRYDLRNLFDLGRYLLPLPHLPVHWRRRALALGSGDPSRAICSTLIAELFQSLRYPMLPIVGAEDMADTARDRHRREVLTDLKDGNMYAVGRPHTGRSTVRSRTPAPPPKVFSFPLEDAAIVNALNRIPTT